MANTSIQIKYSEVTNAPTTLNIAEPAYSYVSNTLYIGSPAGTGSIPIAGKIYVEQHPLIFDLVNASFIHANSSYQSQNATGQYANAAFLRANNSISANAGGTITGDLNITGNLTVTGNTTYTNTQTVLIADNILTLNAAISRSAQPTVNAGIEVDRGAQPNAQFIWIETSGK